MGGNQSKKNVNIKLYLLIIYCVVIAVCQEGVCEAQSEPDNIGFLEPTEQPGKPIMDRTHSAIGSQIHRLADYIDSFFEDPNEVEEVDDDWLRVKGGWGVNSDGRYKLKREVKLHLDLKPLKRRFSLLFESESKDRTPNAIVETEDEAGRTEAGLRYLFNSTSRTRMNADVGLRVNHYADPFLKLRLRHILLETDQWIIRPIQTIKFTGRKGIKATTTLEYDQRWGSKQLLRFREKATWRSKENGLQLSSAILFYSPINEYSAAVAKAQMVARTYPSTFIESYWLSLKYRRQFWRKWLFFEIEPAVLFLREDHFDPFPGISFLIEVTFGQH